MFECGSCKDKDYKEIKQLTSTKEINKYSKNKSSQKRLKEELCIMPQDPFYSTKRLDGLVRHEVFFGRKNRQLSIDLGLVIFITAEQHTGNPNGVHQNAKLDLYLKRLGQVAYMEYYNKTAEEFRELFGRNYI